MDLPRVNHAHVILLLSLIKVTGFVDEWRSACVIHLSFSKAFDMFLHNIIVSKLEYYSLGGWTTTWLNS